MTAVGREMDGVPETPHRRIFIAKRIANRFGDFTLKKGLGEMRDFTLSGAPCVGFVRASRFDTSGSFTDVLDLAVEVISESSLYSDVQGTISDHLRSGASIVFVVDAETEVAWVYMPTQLDGLTKQDKLTIDDALDGGDVVPGWTLPLRELFA